LLDRLGLVLGYIRGIYSLLQNGSSVDAIAEHLSRTEAEGMKLDGSRPSRLREVAAELRNLQLPVVGDPGSAD
jgi:hypothetical protein